MRGKDICAMGKEAFIALAPAFMGDILWEHLEILQREVEKENNAHLEYDIMCVPELTHYQNDYQHNQAGNNNVTHLKATPSPTSTNTSPLHSSNYLHDRKCFTLTFFHLFGNDVISVTIPYLLGRKVLLESVIVIRFAIL